MDLVTIQQKSHDGQNTCNRSQIGASCSGTAELEYFTITKCG